MAFLTLAVYLPSLGNGFVNWDDPDYVLNNEHIRSLNGAFFRWAFTFFHASNWHPLTWLSHALDYAVWGLNPLGHHLTNILLHGLNTFLVVLLTGRLMEARQGDEVFPDEGGVMIAAGVTGLLFGIHPLHVESVAWVAERKDLLCGLFFLLCLMEYTGYVTAGQYSSPGLPSAPAVHPFKSGGGRGRYLLCIAFFVLALMSKPMAVSLPAVLLLLDWYPFGRVLSLRSLGAAVVEKAPFFLLSLAASVVTLVAQKMTGEVALPEEVPFAGRAMVAIQSLAAYLGKLAMPYDLSPFYPYPKSISLLSVEFLWAAALVAVITVLCITAVKRQRIFMATWGYYLVTLLPVIGIVRVGSQSMADRYTYLPALGPFLLVGLAGAWVWGKAGSMKHWGRAMRYPPVAAAVILVILLSYLTVKQTAVWRNSIDLWSYVIDGEPGRVPIAYNNRGLAYEGIGDMDRAIADFTKAIAIDPFDYASYMAYVNRGMVFRELGNTCKALEDYNMAIILNPDRSGAYYSRGCLYAETGQLNLALGDYSRAIELDPLFSPAYNSRGLVLEELSEIDRAMEDYDLAIRLQPYDYMAYNNRGNLYMKKGVRPLAEKDYQKACDLGSGAGCDALRTARLL